MLIRFQGSSFSLRKFLDGERRGRIESLVALVEFQKAQLHPNLIFLTTLPSNSKPTKIVILLNIYGANKNADSA